MRGWPNKSSSFFMKTICPVCQREIPTGKEDKHHLIPLSKGGKLKQTVDLHRICHEKIHSLWDNNQLKNEFNTIYSMLASGQLDAFIKWIRKKPNGFYEPTIMHNKRKR